MRYVAEYEEEGAEGGGILIFEVEKGIIKSISYTLADNNQTSKMIFLFELYFRLHLLKIRDLTPSERKLYFSQITSLSIN
ncbi:MAG: hypothetical protein IJP69_02050 [Synergistaceae bacterium]|nr:hypothetical protein [Synergistaceae bacterium]MBR0233210.1 hypothetical protein [Synergistaceae bacterium]MBR0251978.1 hypothetical protein [Synergistaceae bacterium]